MRNSIAIIREATNLWDGEDPFMDPSFTVTNSLEPMLVNYKFLPKNGQYSYNNENMNYTYKGRFSFVDIEEEANYLSAYLRGVFLITFLHTHIEHGTPQPPTLNMGGVQIVLAGFKENICNECIREFLASNAAQTLKKITRNSFNIERDSPVPVWRLQQESMRKVTLYITFPVLIEFARITNK